MVTPGGDLPCFALGSVLEVRARIRAGTGAAWTDAVKEWVRLSVDYTGMHDLAPADISGWLQM